MAVGFSFCKSGITLVLGPFFSPAIFIFSGEGNFYDLSYCVSSVLRESCGKSHFVITFYETLPEI